MVPPTCPHSVDALLTKLNNNMTLISISSNNCRHHFQLEHTFSKLQAKNENTLVLAAGRPSSNFLFFLILVLLPPVALRLWKLSLDIPTHCKQKTPRLLHSLANTDTAEEGSAHVYYFYNERTSTDLDRSVLHLPIFVQVAKKKDRRIAHALITAQNFALNFEP